MKELIYLTPRDFYSISKIGDKIVNKSNFVKFTLIDKYTTKTVKMCAVCGCWINTNYHMKFTYGQGEVSTISSENKNWEDYIWIDYDSYMNKQKEEYVVYLKSELDNKTITIEEFANMLITII